MSNLFLSPIKTGDDFEGYELDEWTKEIRGKDYSTYKPIGVVISNKKWKLDNMRSGHLRISTDDIDRFIKALEIMKAGLQREKL